MDPAALHDTSPVEVDQDVAAGSLYFEGDLERRLLPSGRGRRRVVGICRRAFEGQLASRARLANLRVISFLSRPVLPACRQD
jgi:hypothetical protein